ncbi:LacI family DNA-binding transcriptional regulator [Brachybacterium sp. J144]|uniref:LacI family DNA-binding transcriptional regulator n=1 Tax=Brachybacterium sp. J144 TaxID=3116487 RepID=UPI002E7AA83D|nr:LacI family DNA-binding transcriptional regulator [Brachybacterium sp. J144]MEE1650631.1 LacI family DNA-binding transcriptional regulator [Brachybacterium sp. J144]
MTPPAPPTGRHRPPRLRDVAELAGVSIKTVSNVVNDYPHVKPETRERVQAAIAQVGYRPQVAAQQLRTGSSGMITLALPSLTFTYFSDIAQAFIEAAQRRRLTIIVHTTEGGPEAERTVLQGFERVLGDGVIFNPLHLWEEELARMDHTSQPTVFIGEHLPEALPRGSDYVRIDNEAASFDATSHLIAQGRTQLGFLGAITSPHGEQPHSSGTLRRAGFKRALREHGMDPASAVLQEVRDWHRQDGFDGMAALLERMPDVDGVVCANDDLAIGVLARLRRVGRRVPEDVAVIGYDDTPDAPFTSPSLSTISPDKQQLAATVLDLITERIAGYDGPPRTVDVPYTLVTRDSTAVGRRAQTTSEPTSVDPIVSDRPDSETTAPDPSAVDLEELPR